MRVAIGLRLEGNEDWEQAATYVTEAERLGVDFAWSHESWGMDAATPLAFMAARTSRIRLGSGIMQAGTRTPALVAMTALSLASMSSGRFVLGMGVSWPQVIEGWHGLRFDRPLTRMREIVEVVRREPRRVTFRIVRDGSKVAHWLTWKEVDVAWAPVDGRSTIVRWTATYDRELDPAWYFAPWERYATRRAMEYLNDALLGR